MSSSHRVKLLYFDIRKTYQDILVCGYLMLHHGELGDTGSYFQRSSLDIMMKFLQWRGCIPREAGHDLPDLMSEHIFGVAEGLERSGHGVTKGSANHW